MADKEKGDNKMRESLEEAINIEISKTAARNLPASSGKAVSEHRPLGPETMQRREKRKLLEK